MKPRPQRHVHIPHHESEGPPLRPAEGDEALRRPGGALDAAVLIDQALAEEGIRQSEAFLLSQQSPNLQQRVLVHHPAFDFLVIFVDLRMF